MKIFILKCICCKEKIALIIILKENHSILIASNLLPLKCLDLGPNCSRHFGPKSWLLQKNTILVWIIKGFMIWSNKLTGNKIEIIIIVVSKKRARPMLDLWKLFRNIQRILTRSENMLLQLNVTRSWWSILYVKLFIELFAFRFCQ